MRPQPWGAVSAVGGLAGFNAVPRSLPSRGQPRSFVCSLHRYLGPDYGEAAAGEQRDVVAAAQVPALARQSFPLCMALMTQHLHAEHHLRHGGRIQLGLFLKVCGLCMYYR